MSYNPQNPNGQATSANSSPVVIASDQSALPVSLSGGATSTNQTNGTQQTKITDGTNVGSVVAGDSGFNGVAVGAATKSYTFTTSGTGAQSLGPWNTEGFSMISLHSITNSTIGLTFSAQVAQTSGGTYGNVGNFISAGTASSGSNVPGNPVTTAGVISIAPIVDNYFQLSIIALTSGTWSGTVTLSNHPYSPNGMYVGQNGTWSVGSSSATGSAVPANAFYISGNSSGNLLGINASATSADALAGANTLFTQAFGSIYNGATWDRTRSATGAAASTGTGLLGVGPLGIYNSTAPTVSTGNYERMQLDSSANLKVYLASELNASLDSVSIAGGLMPTSTSLNTYEVQLTTNTTTTVNAATAYITDIVITVSVAGSASTITIEDGQATPNILVDAFATATLSTLPTILTLAHPIKMTTGIKVITAGSSAATVNLWINYYQ